MRPVVAAVGVFDGVHRGHQKIFTKALSRARQMGATAVAVTFDPHPQAVLHPQSAPPLLLPLEERMRRFAEVGIQTAVVVPFTRAFSRWSPDRFVRKVLVQALKVREVVVGHDFRFGVGRSGDVKRLERLGTLYGFKVWVIPPVRIAGERVSSRRIREWIAHGRLGPACRALSSPPAVFGRVVRGVGRGAQLGFPTANVKIEAGVLPPVGVYAVRTRLEGRSYAGMANLGFRPTFRERVPGLRPGTLSRPPLLEVHLFGVRRRLYGRRLSVEFLSRLRGEKRFTSPEALRRQLEQDEARARGVFALQAKGRVV